MRKIKFWQIISLAMLILVFGNWDLKDNNCKNSLYLLKQSQKRYDENNNWQKSEIKIHIQEPRVGNPQRYTKLKLNNEIDYFEMERKREFGIENRIIDSQGNNKIGLNGEYDIPKEVKEKYRIDINRNEVYRKFYEHLYGIPMSITEDLWTKIAPAETGIFEGIPVYEIKIELKEKVISKNWTLIISKETYKVLGLEFNYPESPDHEEELIKFEGEIEVGELILPRIRHWYIKGSEEYLGSDIVVEKLE